MQSSKFLNTKSKYDAKVAQAWEHDVKTSLFIGLLALSTVAVGQNLGAGRNGMAINRYVTDHTATAQLICT